MKRLFFVIVAVLMTMACGQKPPVSALDAMPETGLIRIVVTDPAAVITDIDGYIEQGVPIAGPNLAASWILAELECENFDSLAARTGIDVHGSTVLYAEGVNPQTIGAAVQLSDPDAFWSYTAELGAEWVEADPIEGAVVKTIDTGDMVLTVATYRGVALAAASVGEIQAMIDRLEGRAPHAAVEAPQGSLWMKADVSMIGPMAASQMSMHRDEIISGVSEESPGLEPVLGLYFDFFETLLTQTASFEYTISFGPVDVEATQVVEFVPGSKLASYVPGEVADYTGMLPAGNVALAGRMSIPPDMSRDAMNAVFGALGAGPGPEFVDMTAEMTANTAFAVYSDMPLHMVAVYELPEGVGLEQIRAWVESSLAFSQEFLAGMGPVQGFTITPPAEKEIGGVDYITYSMTIDPSAMAPTGSPDLETQSMTFTAWLTVTEGNVVMEMAPHPLLIPGILSGTIEGGTVSEMDYFASAGSGTDAVFAFEMGGYMRMIASFAPEEMAGLEALAGSAAWVFGMVDFTDGTAMRGSSRFAGADLAGFIGNLVTQAGAFAR
ncbi:hypothetical protein GX411_00690 [Candidatus Fermentibacteria bacterium]|nr:hypothetical protein [Candidatus Fermentibacteria bacterium]